MRDHPGRADGGPRAARLALDGPARLDPAGGSGPALRPHPLASTPAPHALAALTPDEAIARIASRQAGLIARRQLIALGVGRGAIGGRIARGALRPRRRGVYAVGHDAASAHRDEWEAVLALGPATVLRARSAAALWEIGPTPEAVEVLLPGPHRGLPGIDVRRSGTAGASTAVRRHGLPVTTVARTLVDLATVASAREVELAFDRADVARRLNRAALAVLLRANGSRRGSGALRALLAAEGRDPMLTESELEELLLARLRKAGLPEPATQVWIGGYRVDFCWADLRVIAEADGLAVHGRRSALRRDRRRTNDLSDAGWIVVAFVWDDVVEDPVYVVATIAAALERAARR